MLHQSFQKAMKVIDLLGELLPCLNSSTIPTGTTYDSGTYVELPTNFPKLSRQAGLFLGEAGSCSLNLCASDQTAGRSIPSYHTKILTYDSDASVQL